MNPEQLKEFSGSMEKACKVRVIGPSAVGWAMKMLLKYVLRQWATYLPDLASYLRPCCLYFFGRVYVVLDFNVGCTAVPWTTQVKTITHECGHAFDIRAYIAKEGKTWLNWLRNYLTDDTFRAWAEGTPNTAAAEVDYFLTGRYLTPVCDYGAYLIADKSADRLFREGCETRKEAVLIKDEKLWLPTQRSARLAISILKGLGVKTPKKGPV